MARDEDPIVRTPIFLSPLGVIRGFAVVLAGVLASCALVVIVGLGARAAGVFRQPDPTALAVLMGAGTLLMVQLMFRLRERARKHSRALIEVYVDRVMLPLELNPPTVVKLSYAELVSFGIRKVGGKDQLVFELSDRRLVQYPATCFFTKDGMQTVVDALRRKLVVYDEAKLRAIDARTTPAR